MGPRSESCCEDDMRVWRVWQDSNKYTPLHLAVENGHVSTVATLLKSDADPCTMADGV